VVVGSAVTGVVVPLARRVGVVVVVVAAAVADAD
jgi:hypothetical protein